MHYNTLMSHYSPEEVVKHEAIDCTLYIELVKYKGEDPNEIVKGPKFMNNLTLPEMYFRYDLTHNKSVWVIN